MTPEQSKESFCYSFDCSCVFNETNVSNKWDTSLSIIPLFFYEK